MGHRRESENEDEWCHFSHLNPFLSLPIHRWARTGSTLPWWSTGSSCGSLCLCACPAHWACSCSRFSRITQSRPSPARQADHSQAENTLTWRLHGPISTAGQGPGQGRRVWALLCLLKWKRELQLNSDHAHYLYSNVFATKKLFFLDEEKGKQHHTFTCSLLSRCLMDWPPLSAGKVPPCSPLQPVRERGCSDLLLVALLRQPINTLRSTLTSQLTPDMPAFNFDLTPPRCWLMTEGANLKGREVPIKVLIHLFYFSWNPLCQWANSVYFIIA